MEDRRADAGAEREEDDDPFASLPAPSASSAIPAASASLRTVTSRPPSASENSLRASVPIHFLSMLAADRATPPVTTLGRVIPTGPSHSAWRMISATVSATASGVDGWGVRSLMRSPTSWPVSRSTTPPLTPLPPTSTPNPVLVMACAPSCRRRRVLRRSSAARHTSVSTRVRWVMTPVVRNVSGGVRQRKCVPMGGCMHPRVQSPHQATSAPIPGDYSRSPWRWPRRPPPTSGRDGPRSSESSASERDPAIPSRRRAPPTDPVTVVDTESEQVIRDRLAELRPDDAILGEEGGGERRIPSPRCGGSWIRSTAP